MSSNHDVKWLKPEEVARRWRTSPDTILREIRAGRLRALQIGQRTFRISRDVIEERENAGHIVTHKRAESPASHAGVPDELGD